MGGHWLPVLLALAFDRLLGEPANRFHPVAWMGRALSAAERRAPRRPRAALVYGAGVMILGVAGAAVAGWAWERAAGWLPPVAAWAFEAWALKLTLSVRALEEAAGRVRDALRAGDLPEARRLLARDLVSRDTSGLDGARIAAAAIQSVAENAADAVVAPLLFYALWGLPGALAYRFVNTADAVLGYRDPVHEWSGKAAARLDDLLNLLPARLTALLLVVAAALTGQDARRAWRVWRRDARKTPSPNAGHPMSAMAGALGVELEKVGVYRLGEGVAPRPEDIDRALRMLRATAGLAASLAVAVTAPAASGG